MYDLSGSAHFINKCDNGIVIHRNRNPDAGPVDQVQVGFIFEVLFYQFISGYLFICSWKKEEKVVGHSSRFRNGNLFLKNS